MRLSVDADRHVSVSLSVCNYACGEANSCGWCRRPAGRKPDHVRRWWGGWRSGAHARTLPRQQPCTRRRMIHHDEIAIAPVQSCRMLQPTRSPSAPATVIVYDIVPHQSKPPQPKIPQMPPPLAENIIGPRRLISGLFCLFHPPQSKALIGQKPLQMKASPRTNVPSSRKYYAYRHLPWAYVLGACVHIFRSVWHCAALVHSLSTGDMPLFL